MKQAKFSIMFCYTSMPMFCNFIIVFRKRREPNCKMTIVLEILTTIVNKTFCIKRFCKNQSIIWSVLLITCHAIKSYARLFRQALAELPYQSLLPYFVKSLRHIQEDGGTDLLFSPLMQFCNFDVISNPG